MPLGRVPRRKLFVHCAGILCQGGVEKIKYPYSSLSLMLMSCMAYRAPTQVPLPLKDCQTVSTQLFHSLYIHPYFLTNIHFPPQNLSTKFIHKIYPQNLSTKFTHKIHPQNPSTKSIHKIHPQNPSTKSIYNIYAQHPSTMFCEFHIQG